MVGKTGGGGGASSTAPTATSTSSTPGKTPPSPAGSKKDGAGGVPSLQSASEAKDDMMDLKEKEVEPVGQEYIEEIKGTEGDPQGGSHGSICGSR